MTSRKLLILGIAALVAVATGLWLAGRQGASGDAAHGALYPQLTQQLDEIHTVRLFEAGDTQAVELQRQGTGSDARWSVRERDGYAADAAKLRNLLRSIADAKIFEEKTANPQHYASLGVQDLGAQNPNVQDRKAQDPKTQDTDTPSLNTPFLDTPSLDTTGAGGVRIELRGAAQPEGETESATGGQTDDHAVNQAVNPIVNLIVGKRGAGARSNYVRRAGEPQSWLIDTAIDAPTSPADWLRKDLLDISADRIQAASVTMKKQPTWTASKASRAAADFTVEGLPRGKKLSSSSAANSMATALVGLTLIDVQPTTQLQTADARASFKTFDGLLVNLEGWQHEDRHFIAVTADYEAPTGSVGTAEPKATSGDAGAAGSKATDPIPATEAEAQDLRARLSGWVYEIPEYKYDGIFKPVDDLLAP